jgi:V/A-type H+/Na+-transporting ATPase subunit K
MINIIYYIGAALILNILVSLLSIKLEGRRKIKKTIIGINFILIVGLLIFSINLFFPHFASAAEIAEDTDSTGLGYLAAGLAVGLASIGAGIGVGIAGASAIGAISEKPEILGRTLIFIGLAEGVAIYGLIISIMILGRL